MEFSNLLPTGQWKGFYLESHQSQRGWMHQYLEFDEGRFKGEGTDYVGPWTLHGTYDLASRKCSWVKSYVGKHEVNYSGEISDKGITGVWDIRGLSSGPFHVWPQHMTEFDTLYMQEDLESTPLRNRQQGSPGQLPEQPPIHFDGHDRGTFLA